MKHFLVVLLLFTVVYGTEFEPYGEKLFKEHCMTCHQLETTELTDNSILKAPPLDILVHQIKYYYRDEEKFVEYLSDFLRQPSEDKSICIPCVRRWGLMPPQQLSDEEIQAIGKWMFNAYR
ncbi:c-type cytochrome [Persephonella sp.]